MGRPLRKDVKGTDVIGTPAGAETGITVSFHDGSTVQNDGIIIKQRGARTFVVARVGTPLERYTRVLVDGVPAAGQMRMRGSTTGLLDQDLVSIRKITKRVATGFNDVKYTWFLENDSSADYIVLTPVAGA
jgi:ribosomal protein L27